MTRPSSARMYDYFLGGFHNFEADRAAAEQVLTVSPGIPALAQQNRAFLRQAVTHLVELGVRQFVDIGSGIPTVGNVHTVAQQADPTARVVYVDVDPVAVAHSTAILDGTAGCAAIAGDLRRPDEILHHPQVRACLDLTEPVGLLMVAVLHFVPDDDDPWAAIASYRDALAPGSGLVISHAIDDRSDEERAEEMAAVREVYRRTPSPVTIRTRDQITRFFDGYDLLEPGVVAVQSWHPGPPRDEDPGHTPVIAGVGISH